MLYPFIGIKIYNDGNQDNGEDDFKNYNFKLTRYQISYHGLSSISIDYKFN